MFTSLLISRIIEDDVIGVMIDINLTKMRPSRTQRADSINFNLDDWKKNLQHIMDQYIYTDGEFCVNVSALTRRKLISLSQHTLALPPASM